MFFFWFNNGPDEEPRGISKWLTKDRPWFWTKRANDLRAEKHLNELKKRHIKRLALIGKLRLVSDYVGADGRAVYECIKCGHVQFFETTKANRGFRLKDCDCQPNGNTPIPAKYAYKARLPGETAEQHQLRVQEVERNQGEK